MTRYVAVAVALALAMPAVSARAEVWTCTKDGVTLFTDQADDSKNCQRYEAGAPAGLIPSVAPTGAEPATPEAAPARPPVSQPELDQILAPIALYPDALLSQILMASTYPLEVVEAARWARANPNLKGDEAVQAVAQKNWDPSVKSLAAFPQILTMMDEHLEWMQRLGDAFLSQQAHVMDTAQSLRQKAYAAGNLKSTDQLRVEQQGPTIVVEQANPQVVYVPYYDPLWVYGPWWWPAYPPVYWAPWPGYFVRPGIFFGFGVGISVRAGFFFGAFDWPHRHVTVVNNNVFINRTVTVNREGVWQHDPAHRRSVPYHDAAVRQQFAGANAAPDGRREFRGHDRPAFQGGTFNRQSAPSIPNGSAQPRIEQRPHIERSPHAFEGVGRGPDVRSFSERGHASASSPPHVSSNGRASGGGHGGGGGGHSGGGGHNGGGRR